MSKFVKILTKFWPKIWPQFRELDFELRESVKILTQILTTFSELDFEPRKSVKILPRFRSETPISVRNRVSVSETAFRPPKPRFDPRNPKKCSKPLGNRKKRVFLRFPKLERNFLNLEHIFRFLRNPVDFPDFFRSEPPKTRVSERSERQKPKKRAPD